MQCPGAGEEGRGDDARHIPHHGGIELNEHELVVGNGRIKALRGQNDNVVRLGVLGKGNGSKGQHNSKDLRTLR